MITIEAVSSETFNRKEQKMIDLSEVSYGEILDCIVDASLGRLSPYFQEYARHEIASLANADGELPQAAVILQDVLERLLNEIPQISDEE